MLMAPKRKSRSVNKRLSAVYDVSPSKGGASSKTSLQRKRKLSDMLGSQWSKEELEHFYEAFRKYGKNWKKVSAAVRNRSADMVEALYTMNRAYLSLPEGTASVVGLIAMMTDHYCNLEGSNSEQESNDGGATSRKSQKLGLGKVRTSTSKGYEGPLHSQTSASNSDCLSLLKKKHAGESQPWAVGKRTPRVQVSFPHDRSTGGRFFSPTRQGLKQKADANDDDVAHEVALALAEVSQRGGSPQKSQTPNRRTGSVQSSPARSGDMIGTELELMGAKFGKNKVMDENGFEGRLETKIGGKFVFPENRRRLNVKKPDMEYGIGNHLDDIREASSETEGQNFGIKVGKLERTSPQVSRKKRNQVLFNADEGSEFDALQTLADLSLMMPATSENESAVQAKEEDEVADKGEISGVKAKGIQDVAKKSKLGKASGTDATSSHKANEERQESMSGPSRKKQKIFTSKIPVTEVRSDTHPRELQEVIMIDAGNKLNSSGRLSSDSPLQQKQGKLVKHHADSSSVDHREEKDESVPSTAHVPMANQVDLSKKVRSRRKPELQKPQNIRDLSKSLTNNKPNLSNPSVLRAPNLQAALSNCLSNNQVRRRCAFEWFYSSIDYPWFAKREFVEYLNHVGLGHIPRLTRVEWGVIRSSLGKPRRFSEQFLKEEKEKLNQYRASVREHYSELREGTREGLPTDLARPLSVGQRVMAIHPRTREIHDGNVLTVDLNRCRVQFDRPELGVEFVLDIDCMPSNPIENMPASLATNTVTMDKLFASLNELKMRGVAKDQKLEGLMNFSSGEAFKHDDVPSHVLSEYPLSNLLKQIKGIPSTPNSHAKTGVHKAKSAQHMVNSALQAQVQAEETDVQALAELRRALDKKEAVVSELRQMNDGLLASRREGDTASKDSESFKKHIAAVVVQLDEVNDQVTRALQDLRKGNTYNVTSQPLWPKSTVTVGDSGGPLNLCDSLANHVQESASNVHEIVESSRRKARTMVDSAAQAMSSLNGGDNSINGIEETIDHISNRLSVDYSPTDPIHGPEFELKNVLDQNELQIPSELISHCVATLFMIQKCTEREFPPEDVAQILDSAALSLQPCCSQNLVVYGEIQKCMGIIRNQILALVPN